MWPGRTRGTPVAKKGKKEPWDSYSKGRKAAGVGFISSRGLAVPVCLAAAQQYGGTTDGTYEACMV